MSAALIEDRSRGSRIAVHDVPPRSRDNDAVSDREVRHVRREMQAILMVGEFELIERSVIHVCNVHRPVLRVLD